ncbi:MAG: hypothetical protein WB773_20055 [Isosphaeraceae bacterium]
MSAKSVCSASALARARIVPEGSAIELAPINRKRQLPARKSLMNSRVVVLSIVLLVPPDRQVGWCRESSDYLILPDRMIK